MIVRLYDEAIKDILGRKAERPIQILSGLDAALDMDAGGEVSKSLRILYKYVQKKLKEEPFQQKSDRLEDIIYTSLKGMLEFQ